MADADSLLDVSVRQLLDLVPARSPAPAAGSIAALVAALAAGLAAMAGRYAPDDWQPKADLVRSAEDLRRRLEPLADADVDAFAAYLETRDIDPIVKVPLEIAEAAAGVAALSARIAEEGNRAVAGDAAAAAALAASAARVAAHLVGLNLGARDDERRAHSRALADQAEELATQALAAAR